MAIEADSTMFKQYSGGVIEGYWCGSQVDHSVIIVGYAEDYFIVKNSWSEFWGEQGYARIAFADGPGTCGIN